jgi:hypothetical protein
MRKVHSEGAPPALFKDKINVINMTLGFALLITLTHL